MKNNLVNQDIKTDKPVPMSYEALKADRDALADKLARLEYNLGNALIGEQETIRRADALAVENAALKDAITTHSQSTHFCELCGKDDPCSTDDVCCALNETTATDAALAAIRTKEHADFIAVFNEHIKTAGLDDDELVTVRECRDALKHATELREAK